MKRLPNNIPLPRLPRLPLPETCIPAQRIPLPR